MGALRANRAGRWHRRIRRWRRCSPQRVTATASASASPETGWNAAFGRDSLRLTPHLALFLIPMLLILWPGCARISLTHCHAQPPSPAGQRTAHADSSSDRRTHPNGTPRQTQDGADLRSKYGTKKTALPDLRGRLTSAPIRLARPFFIASWCRGDEWQPLATLPPDEHHGCLRRW
jgi:hypothetical protein